MMHRLHKGDSLATFPLIRRAQVEGVHTVRVVLESPPMQALRSLLDRKGLRVESQPLVYKDFSDSLVRLMFPVTGGPIVDGAVVSVVCLFDRHADRTLYAHPMHAGPGVNPLVRHLDGPMAAPKSQMNADGDRASRRIIEHKKALWRRFVRELPNLGEKKAGERWRNGYYWSLKRLYFCSGCTQCKWGSPFFEGPDPFLPSKAIIATVPSPARPLDGEHRAIVTDILASDSWTVEAAYVARGGFAAIEVPRLLKELDGEFVQVIFPTNALLLQAGTLVAIAFTYHRPTQNVIFSHCLCAGAETEIQFAKSDVAFGLSLRTRGVSCEDALSTYVSWRCSAWSQFWLDDLESGVAVASEAWLKDFWDALELLFDGNDISDRKQRAPLPHGNSASCLEVAGRKGIILPPQALENIGGRCFAGHATNREPTELRALGLSTLMVNLGRRCNQACHHCHIEAGPNRTEEMTRETVDLVLNALQRFDIETLDITGGAPEMNPHFRYLATEASKLGCRVVDRCNLTIFFEPGHEDLPEFLAEHGIQITASLPSKQEDVTDHQRGLGSFAKSITALQKLNALGYGQSSTGLILNLVSNPSGTDLGAPQDVSERQFKQELYDLHGIVFNRLFAMNNMPIKRFKHYLRREGQWSGYMKRLAGAFNSDAVEGLMCRRTLSVGYDGRLYDCDFNQAMDVPLCRGLPAHIRDLDAKILRSRTINTGSHCFGCTAGAGSSCNGALVGITCDTRATENKSPKTGPPRGER